MKRANGRNGNVECPLCISQNKTWQLNVYYKGAVCELFSVLAIVADERGSLLVYRVVSVATLKSAISGTSRSFSRLSLFGFSP